MELLYTIILDLIQGYWKTYCTRPSSDPPTSQGISGEEWRQQERNVKLKLQKKPLLL